MLTDLQEIGVKLETQLKLRTAPVAFKFIESVDEIPQGAIRPLRDRGYHLAQCQAFSLSRRNRLTVAMLKEDHWCWAPLVWYGLVKRPENLLTEGKPFYPDLIPDRAKAVEMLFQLPVLPEGKFIGLLTAPLTDAHFVPHGVLIYCNSAQIRTLLMSFVYSQQTFLSSLVFPFNSCILSTVPVFQEKRCVLVFPDPGEFQRALAGEEEIVFSVPIAMLEPLLVALEHFDSTGHGYATFAYEMRPDFPRPPFYDNLFEFWGLGSSSEKASCGGIDWNARRMQRTISSGINNL